MKTVHLVVGVSVAATAWFLAGWSAVLSVQC